MECANCKLNFTNFNDHLKHILKEHKHVHTYNCPTKICTRKFSTVKALRNHFNRHKIENEK